MPLKKIIIATFLSLPLVPFLLLPVGALDGPIATSGSFWLWAAPFILDFAGFYALYSFVRRQNNFSKDQQKRLLVIATGVFVILSVPLVITQIATAHLTASSVEFLLLLGYALAGLVIHAKKVSQSSAHIKPYFVNHYVWPGIAAFTLMFTLIVVANLELNAVTCYFIFKNYVFALSKD